MSTRRKTFAAREDLIDTIKEIARRKGYSLYDYVNELFEAAIRAEKTGYSISGVVEEILFIKQVRESGFILVPENVFQAMVKLAYTRREEALKAWWEAGLWMGKSYRAKYGGDALNKFRDMAHRVFWDIPELEVSSTGDEVEIVVTSPKFSQEYAEVFKRMLEGLLEGLSYSVINSEIIGKTIRLKGRLRNV